MRIELTTPGLQDQCSNHWAMEAYTNFSFTYFILKPLFFLIQNLVLQVNIWPSLITSHFSVFNTMYSFLVLCSFGSKVGEIEMQCQSGNIPCKWLWYLGQCTHVVIISILTCFRFCFLRFRCWHYLWSVRWKGTHKDTACMLKILQWCWNKQTWNIKISKLILTVFFFKEIKG